MAKKIRAVVKLQIAAGKGREREDRVVDVDVREVHVGGAVVRGDAVPVGVGSPRVRDVDVDSQPGVARRRRNRGCRCVVP